MKVHVSTLTRYPMGSEYRDRSYPVPTHIPIRCYVRELIREHLWDKRNDIPKPIGGTVTIRLDCTVKPYMDIEWRSYEATK